MKKIILFVGLLFCSLTQAQVINALGNNEQITEGKVFTFGELGTHTKLNLKVTNASPSNTINLKLRLVEATNKTGNQGTQLCFGEQCFDNIAINLAMPTEPSTGLSLAPGQSNTAGNYFFNNYGGDNSSQPVRYKFEYFTVDNNNSNENVVLTFFYEYNAAAANTNFTSLQNIGITVSNTVIKNSLNLTTTQKAKMEVYNISGQVVKTAAIQTGTQAINMTELSAAPYIVRFTNDKNQTSQIKVVKQ